MFKRPRRAISHVSDLKRWVNKVCSMTILIRTDKMLKNQNINKSDNLKKIDQNIVYFT